MLALYFQILKRERALLLLHPMLRIALLKLSKRQRVDQVNEFMLTRGDRLEELNLDRALDVVTTEIGRTKLDLVPFEGATFGSLDLRLEHRRPLVHARLAIDEEEAETGLGQGRDRIEDDDLRVGGCGQLCSLKSDGTIFVDPALLVDKGLGHALVARSVDLVKLEFECTDEIMLTQVLGHLRVVIAVVDLDLVELLLLKVEVNLVAHADIKGGQPPFCSQW